MTVHDSDSSGRAGGPDGPGIPGGPGGPGPLEDEAAKLAEALQYWASQHLLPLAQEFGGSEECQVCPVCRFMALVRGERPEVMAHLSDAAGALAAAFAAAVAPPEDAARPTHSTHRGEQNDWAEGKGAAGFGDEPMSASG
jgi:hypothetical protein